MPDENEKARDEAEKKMNEDDEKEKQMAHEEEEKEKAMAESTIPPPTAGQPPASTDAGNPGEKQPGDPTKNDQGV